MVEFKLVISNPKGGKSAQRDCKEPDSKKFVGLKIADKVKGELIDLGGYELQITGGSDYCGFPMRKDLPGTARKKILAVRGIGIRNTEKGIKVRKTVCGNTIYARTSQINLKVLKEGKENIFLEKKEEKKE